MPVVAVFVVVSVVMFVVVVVDVVEVAVEDSDVTVDVDVVAAVDGVVVAAVNDVVLAETVRLAVTRTPHDRHCSSDTTGTRLHNPTYIISHKIKTLIFFFKFLHQVLHIHDVDAVSGVAIQAPQSHHHLIYLGTQDLDLAKPGRPHVVLVNTSRNSTTCLSAHAFVVVLSTHRSPRHVASGLFNRPFFLYCHNQSKPHVHTTSTRGEYSSSTQRFLGPVGSGKCVPHVSARTVELARV